MIDSIRRLTVIIPGFVSLLFVAGCLSDNPGSRSMAFVDIERQGAYEVREAAINLYEDDGYRLSESTDQILVFEREATQRDLALYGHYGDDRLVIRLVVAIEPRRQGGTLVRCDAFAVRDGREELMSRVARRPFQRQLNRLKASLVSSADDEK